MASEDFPKLRNQAEGQAVLDLSHKYSPIFFGASFAIVLTKPEVVTQGEVFGPHSKVIVAGMLFAGMASVMFLEIWESYGKVFVNRPKELPGLLRIASIIQLLVSGILVMALFEQLLK